MRLIPRSIRGRIVALSAIAMLVSLIVSGLVIAAVLSRIVTQGVDRRLDAQIALLATMVDRNGRIDEGRLGSVEGALEAGPGWRWQIVTPDRTIGSDAFPLSGSEREERGGPRHHERGPQPRDESDVDGSPAHARELTVMTASGSVVLRAVAPREVIERPIRDALLPLLFLLALLSVVLAAAGVAQVYFGLRPLRAFRDAVADIRWGRARQVPDDQPSELKPLAQELNAFARDNHAALAAARASAANLAHALKTPVATLALELRDEPERARQVARIDATIRHHLSRARGRVTDRQAHTLVAIAVADLVHTVARLTAERAVQIDIVGNLHVSVAVDQRDFDEIVGNLLDNAVRHTRSQVIIRADCADGFLRLSIEDDGMGIPSTERARAAEPGVRLDERGAGHGFGLAIAGELSELYGGRLTLEQSHSGGLAAAVRLPLWTVSGS